MKKIYNNILILAAAVFILTGCAQDNAGPNTNGTDRSVGLGNPGGGGGQGGSMARFTISGNYLFMINDRELKVFDISQTAQPVHVTDITISNDIETVYPYKNHLFIGAQSGMHIYNISNPSDPQFVSTYTHVTSCDPVVVNDKYAYVTLSTITNSSRCNRGVNQLQILDISNLSSPHVIQTYDMTQPLGMGLDSTTLFLCDGNQGLKVLDVNDPYNVQTIDRVDNITTYDAIASNGLLLVTGGTGLHQFSYADRSNLIRLSDILVK